MNIEIKPESIWKSRGDSPLLVGERVCDRGSDLRADLTRLLRAEPRSRLRRNAVLVALSSPDVIVKRLGGLPPIADARTLQSVVEQQISRFFTIEAARNNRVRTELRGRDAFAASYTPAIVDAVIEACVDSNARLVMMAPREEYSQWPPNTSALPRLGINTRVSEARRSNAYVRISTCCAAGLGLTLAIVGPGIRASLALRRSQIELRNLSSQRTRLDSIEASLDLQARLQAETTRFEHGRSFASELFGNLSTVLPESTAISAIHFDSVGVTMTIVGTDVIEAVSALSANSYFHNVELQGGVIEDKIGAVAVERATMRFGIPKSAKQRMARQ